VLWQVKEAQAEVVTVTSLLHLDTLVGDDAMERTLVIAFCQPPNEKVVDEQVRRSPPPPCPSRRTSRVVCITSDA
jgi:hypothetical protein